MSIVNGSLQIAKRTTAQIAASSTVLLDGQIVINSDNGKYCFGDGVTALSALTFYGGTSTAPTWGAITGTLTAQTDLTSYLSTNYQPLDADLTAIAALTTDAFGRGLLPLTTAGAVRTYIGAGTGNGDALVANPLSQFAATTSAQLAGVISDETGSGALVFGTSPTFTTDLTTPKIYGSSSSGGTLTLQSTSHATKGKILFGTSAYDEVNNRLGIGTASPSVALHIVGAATVSTTLGVTGQATFSSFVSVSNTLFYPTASSNWVIQTTGVTSGILLQSRQTSGTNNNYLFHNGGGLNIGANADPAAWLKIAAGTTTMNPLTLTSGTNLTTPISGAVEFDNTFYMTQSDAVRRNVVLATNATKTTAGAPYANDGYITIRIGGTDVKVMTTA